MKKSKIKNTYMRPSGRPRGTITRIRNLLGFESTDEFSKFFGIPCIAYKKLVQRPLNENYVGYWIDIDKQLQLYSNNCIVARKIIEKHVKEAYLQKYVEEKRKEQENGENEI